MKRLTAALLCVLMILAPLTVQAKGGYEEKYDTTEAYLKNCPTPTVGSMGGEWMVIGLARGNGISREMEEGYYQNVLSTVRDNGSEKLHRSKATENARVILALTAIGKDVTDVAGYNLLAPLADFKFVTKQGLNGAVWTLIALDSMLYDIPETDAQDVTTREKLIDCILSRQNESGGWDIKNDYADPDMTGMVLQSLAPYYEHNEAVKTAVDNALRVMSENQLDDGGFLTYGSPTPESCAQMLTALCSLGIDPQKDSRFIKNGRSVLDRMLDFSVENGFEHLQNDGFNQMSTEQAFYAMTALNRLENGKTALYDMSDLLLPYDVNLDGQVNIIDATETQKYIAELRNFNLRQQKAAHADVNGKVNITVVTEIQRFISMQ